MSSPEDGTDDSSDVSTNLTTTAISSAYKVLGELTDTDGVGVLGQNNAESGTPIGVRGAVPNASGGYGLYTKQDARIEGSLQFTADDSTPTTPHMFMQTEGASKPDRMVLAHSPTYPDWGLGYDDSDDQFHFKASGAENATVDLSSGDISSNGNMTATGTVGATRVEADRVLTAEAGTIVWDAYDQSIPSGTATKVEFDNVEADQRNAWDQTNHTITVAEPGNYLLSAGLSWKDDPSSGTNNWFTVRRNGNVGVAQDFSDGPRQLQASRPVLGANAGDTFHMEVEQYEGSDLRVGGSRLSTYLSVVQL